MSDQTVSQRFLSQVDFNKPVILEGIKKSSFLNTKEAAEFLGLNNRTLENMRYCGNGPVFRKYGNRVYYHINDLKY